MPHPKKIYGSALLTALFIMTLVAIVATAMSMRLQLDIYRTRLIVTYDKLFLASQAITFWALGELGNSNNQYTQLYKSGAIAQYPKNMEALVDQIRLSGNLYDLQARFNINNLTEQKILPSFISFLNNTTKLQGPDRLNLALAIKDWISDYELGRGKDNYTSYYLSQKPPYYPSHQIMAVPSELRLIKDVNAKLYQSLEPFITILPETTPININTASKEVLRSLGNGLTETQVNELIAARGEKGIKNLKDISEVIKKIDLPSEQITIDSKYFISIAYATTDEFKIAVYTVLKRSIDNNKKLTVSIIRQTLSSF